MHWWVRRLATEDDDVINCRRREEAPSSFTPTRRGVNGSFLARCGVHIEGGKSEGGTCRPVGAAVFSDRRKRLWRRLHREIAVRARIRKNGGSWCPGE